MIITKPVETLPLNRPRKEKIFPSKIKVLIFVVLVKVLQRNRTDRMCICMKKAMCFKELDHMARGAGKCKLGRLAGNGESQGRASAAA